MQNFNYYAPTQVVFGRNAENQLASLVKKYGGKKVLVHYGGQSAIKSGLMATVEKQLSDAGIEYVKLGGVVPNPRLSLVRKGIELCKAEGIDFLLAVGGGSVIDSSKAIAVGAKVDFSPWEFSIKNKTPKDHLPVAAVLTISAAGSDMSNSCVITNNETKEKRGFTSECNRCLFSILNPELT